MALKGVNCVKTGSGPHPVSYPTGTGSSLAGGKAAEAWSRPLTSMARYFDKHRDNFTFHSRPSTTVNHLGDRMWQSVGTPNTTSVFRSWHR